MDHRVHPREKVRLANCRFAKVGKDSWCTRPTLYNHHTGSVMKLILADLRNPIRPWQRSKCWQLHALDVLLVSQFSRIMPDSTAVSKVGQARSYVWPSEALHINIGLVPMKCQSSIDQYFSISQTRLPRWVGQHLPQCKALTRQRRMKVSASFCGNQKCNWNKHRGLRKPSKARRKFKREPRKDCRSTGRESSVVSSTNKPGHRKRWLTRDTQVTRNQNNGVKRWKSTEPISFQAPHEWHLDAKMARRDPGGSALEQRWLSQQE